MRVDIWSDIVCPWCYIGKARFERGLAAFAHADRVEVEFHSFQLDPSAPAEPEPALRMLTEKMGITEEQARSAEAGVADNARGEGLDYTTDRPHANTADAHRLLHHAKAEGAQKPMVEALFAAYFGAGEDVFGTEELVALAEQAGLDAGKAREVLEGGAYADEVRRDAEEARTMGATGVPFFVVDSRYGVSGAQPAEVFTRVLEQAWADAHPQAPVMVGGGEGDADGCADGACAVPGE
ncbi:DsbA family oxidoreductase [Nocardiopsis potens]|uniref:DsbA family oxidoreductase n=1 Tax=Nocardiopsis potens TaxID=1246458 RepID=UPI00034AE674|nr:DsbA family oxidoreductase [Nocardiopsis potens]